ncbi:MAG TPA: hypothetical protein VF406_21010, partial [Thermodesulfobacteriota bacterium]
MADVPAYRREATGAHPPVLHPPYASTLKRAPRHPPLRLPHTLSEVTGPLGDRGSSVRPTTTSDAGGASARMPSQ